MNKRTLFFVVSLSITLFLVNMFFDHQRTQNQQEWRTEQLAKKQIQQQKLVQEIKDRSAKPETLPLARIYADKETKLFVDTGVTSGNSLLTLSWAEKLPKTVYAVTGGKTEAYILANSPENIGSLAVYQKGAQQKLRVGNLPEFGQYEVQVVSLNPKHPDTPFTVTVGDYSDGRFIVPAEELYKIQVETTPSEEKTPQNPINNSIVLFKLDNEYLPVGVYNVAEKRLNQLHETQNIPLDIIPLKRLKDSAVGTPGEETFFVLENSYQQLVFSNYGGALAEINLPFETAENKKSVVKPIEFDREMLQDSPSNATFPLHAYYTPGENASGPFVENQKGTVGGYYPLIRRDLLKKGKSTTVPPEFYALNIVSEYPEVAQLVYKVTYFDKQKIVFEASQGHRRITKTYTITDDVAPYILDLTVKIEGDGRGLWLVSGVPEEELISGSPAPVLKYRFTRAGKSEVQKIDLPSESTTVTSTTPDWVCNSNGFFGVILDPLTETDPGYRAQYVSGLAVPTKLTEIRIPSEQFAAKDYPGYMMMLPLKSKGGTMNFRVFAGPFDSTILKTVDKVYSNEETGYNPDYIACQSFHGWFAFISEPFAKFLFILMNFFHYLTGSWGISILLLTIAIRIMLYPLNAWSTRSMLRTQQVMPLVQAVQEKYKNDPKRLQAEMLNVYKEQGVNPLSGITGGCFPLLIQMPFLIGMFDLLKSSSQLRGASFIPGWIDNLTAPDVLFSWTTPIPFIGTEFHLLPILLGLVMFIQPRIMSPLPKDKSEWTDQQRQQRAMSTMMAVMFAWIFYGYPSGLNIYFMFSMVLGIVQQWWAKRNIKPLTPKEIEVTGTKSSKKLKLK